MESYVSSYWMNDDGSGWLRVFSTDMMMKIAAVVLHDEYETYHLWFLSPQCICWLWRLNLSTVLRAVANADEFGALLVVIENIK